MHHRRVKIVNMRGLHARASARFVRLAEGFDATITVRREGHAVPGTSIMGLLLLAAGPGSEIDMEARGKEAGAALDALEKLVESGFGESD